MTGVSRDETASVVIIGITVAVFAWYRTGMTGLHQWTNTAIAFLVGIAVAAAVTSILE
jgi:hypothetical protein